MAAAGIVIASGRAGVPATFGETAAAAAIAGAGVRGGDATVGTLAGVVDGSTIVSADVGCFPGAGGSTTVSAEDIVADRLAGPVVVVFETGSALTGTLFNAARNASALWKRSAGSFAIAIMIISFNSAGRSARNVIGAAGNSFKCAVINE